jgi:uncharacterized membrane protein
MMSADPELLDGMRLFRFMDDEERAAVAAMLRRCEFTAGETIFHQEAPGDSMYLIQRGRVQVGTVSDTGERIVLGENEPGDVFGEISLFDGGPRTATAVATEDTILLTLDRQQLLELVRRQPHVALDLLAVMGARLRLTDQRLRTLVTRNANTIVEDRVTFGDRIADRVAAFGGSWAFILSFGAVLLSWVTLNSYLLVTRRFDPYPYILLNLFLSMIAALQAPVIMMSQNRQSAKDRLKADLDYEINLKAELEIAQLHRKIDHLTMRVEARHAAARPLELAADDQRVR